VMVAQEVRRALAAVRSSLSRQDHRRLTEYSLASTKTLVFSSFTSRKPRSFIPNIRVNSFPQTHEPPESPSYFVYISQHESLHSTPKLAGRSSPTSVSLSRTASRSSNENDTWREYHTRSNKDARWRLTALLLPPCLHPSSLLSIERYFLSHHITRLSAA
jgi:hypothetical protein